MDTTLTRQAADIASDVGDTMTDAVEKGKARAFDLVVAAEELLPDKAIDWTLEHVPGLTPRRRRPSRSTLILVIGLVAAIVAIVWWVKRPTGAEVGDEPAHEQMRRHATEGDVTTAVAGR